MNAIASRRTPFLQLLTGLFQARSDRARVKRTQREMLGLDDHLLADIGMSRIDIMLASLQKRPAGH